MVADDNEKIEDTKVEDENQEKQETSESKEGDIEGQMAEVMAEEMGENVSDEDDLEQHMAAAMATEEDKSSEEDDLERQMAAAMGDGEESSISDDLLDELGEVDDEDLAPVSVKPLKFQQLRPSDEQGGRDNINRLLDVSLNLSVELGRKRMQIKEILDLGPGKIIELDKLAGEPVDLLVNGKLLAKGEVVVVDENFGVRITDLADPKDRIKSL